MATLWLLLVTLMLAAYVVLDGFDLGVGIIYKIVAKTPDERALVRRSIGPVWDANEVWLLAAGATLYFAFPQLYASAFSGFYLPLMMVLWLLIGRALGLEIRSHAEDALVGEACEASFMISSLLLAVFFGAALGNVIRGVPLEADGYFFLPLWTNFRTGAHPGVLDWYTVLCGGVVLVALATHGAHYLAWRSTGEVNTRARRLAHQGTRALPWLTLMSLVATVAVRPSVTHNFLAHPAGLLIPGAVAASLVAMERTTRRGDERRAFFWSVTYLVSMLIGAAFALFPVVLPASGDPSLSLTLASAATGSYAMRVALTWWLVALVLVVATFAHLYRTFRGKLVLGQGDADGYHHD
jgi:cytochrome d ubiquinol oxidase subunit II